MTFDEVLEQVRDLLRSKGRVSYRALKRRFALDDEYLEDLKAEIIKAEQLASDEDGEVLVWTGGKTVASSQLSVASPQPPVAYTPRHLAQHILAEQAAMEARGVTDGERKTITALFADLKGSTALIEDLDPEEARAIIDPALQLMMDAVHRYEGYVAQALGDGIFALFGAPVAHEDHPQRALYAALRMQEEMRRYADTLRRAGGAPLQMRVGVNTGEVVVRSIRKDDLHTDYVPVGHSTNLAARMEQLANPGTILVTEQTHKLTEGYFQFKALGETQVKGVEKPLPIYEVLGVGPLRTRLQVAARRGLTRFVGRQAEQEQMRRAFAHATAGHGQIVGVMGEPGVGKSRLFYEFKLTTPSGCLTLEAFSVSHGKASPYLPLIELLKTYFQITLQDDDRSRREKVMGKVLALDRSLEDILPYLFVLLSVADPHSPLQQMMEDPQVRRRRTFDALKRLFVRESLNQPLILIFEDLHWLDTETQAFLEVLSEGVATTRMLLLVNYRPEYQHGWGNKTYYTQLRLDPLGEEDAEELLTALLSEKVGATHASPLQALKQLILAKTEGNPFFMEEVVQTLVEENVLVGERGNYRLEKTPTDLHISPTVQGVLAARSDRLAADEKELLQTLAVIGREFSLSLLRRVVAQPEEELYRLLSHLQGAEFIYEQPAFPEVEYTFKHALTQEVAYTSLLLERRKVLHERTAQAIEGLYRQGLEDHYSELAHHYSRSGNTQKAVEYLQLAGQQAVQRSANVEAIGHLTTALDLLKMLPDTPERAQQELLVRVALGTALQVTKGYGALDAEKVYTRARELCQQVGETPQLFPVLFGLWVFYLVRAELQTAREFGEQLLTVGQSRRDPTLLAEAHFTLADTLFHLGDFASAREHAEQGLACYEPQQHRTLASTSGYEAGVLCHVYRAWSLWALGYSDQALKSAQEALALAQKASHLPSLAIALDFAAVLHRWRREKQPARERADTAIALCAQYGFSYWLALGTTVRGWVLFEEGQAEEGIAQMREGLALFRSTETELDLPYWLATLAEAYGQVGQVEEGDALLAEARAKMRMEGERFEAELYRLQGQLTLQSKTGLGQVSDKSQASQDQSAVTNPQPPTPNSQVEAEACFQQAIEIARRQSAKSLELRAVMSLCRLWQQQGKKEEARRVLAEIYGWFTEGFNTADLQEAKALLEELDQ